MAYPVTTLSEFQYLIIESLVAQFPEIKTLGAHVRLNRTINTPAAFVELSDFTHPEAQSTDDPSLECRFSIRLVTSSDSDDCQLALEDLAVQVSHFVKGNRWRVNCTPALVLGASHDEFSGIDEAYRAFEIRFEQTIQFDKAKVVPLCKSA